MFKICMFDCLVHCILPVMKVCYLCDSICFFSIFVGCCLLSDNGFGRNACLPESESGQYRIFQFQEIIN